MVLAFIFLCGSVFGEDWAFKDSMALKNLATLIEKGEAHPKDMSEKELVTAANGMGYLRGLLDGMGISEAFGRQLPYRIPEEVTTEQLLLIVGKFLSVNPTRLNQKPVVTVSLALTEAFPNPAVKPPKP